MFCVLKIFNAIICATNIEIICPDIIEISDINQAIFALMIDILIVLFAVPIIFKPFPKGSDNKGIIY